MLKRWIRLLIMYILDRTGLIRKQEVQDYEDLKNKSFWEYLPFGKGGRSQREESNTVDADWREVNEEEEKKQAQTAFTGSSNPNPSGSAPSETEFSDSGSLQDNIRAISKAAEGIRHPKIREQAYHVLIIAKDIIYEHDIGRNKCQNYNQFEKYYVPTVKSVITNYCTIETKGIATDKIQKDVLSYLESCGDAFTKLYNSMFSDDIMTMEIEMEAMDIIMKRDGLL